MSLKRTFKIFRVDVTHLLTFSAISRRKRCLPFFTTAVKLASYLSSIKLLETYGFVVFGNDSPLSMMQLDPF